MHKIWGGILIVSGTTIGAGMLANPVMTSFTGFFPSLLLFFLYWILMTFSALLFLEVSLWMTKQESNMISMAEMTLGHTGKVVCWSVYLFLLYALTTAYLAGGGPILNGLLHDITGYSMPEAWDSLPLLAIFGYFVYRGAHSIDYLNRVLMIGLASTYLLMVFFLFPHVKASLLSHADMKAIWVGSSVIATSFGFHIVIPSLTTYLNRDVKALKKVIIIGSFIPLVVYLIWQYLVLGIVPLDNLAQGYSQGTNGAELLSDYLGDGFLSDTARVFSLIAIVTSFLGVAMSLTDFLADGFNIQRSHWGNVSLIALTFLPPLLITMIDPRVFLLALDYAGAFGVVFLLAFFPALMVWFGRKRHQGTYQAPGGTFALLATMGVSLFLIGIEVLQQLGWL